MTEAARHHHDAGPEAGLIAALAGRSIVLVGMMGAGKSTIGRRIAGRLHIPFLDADHEIEAAHAGMTVPEIFVQHGEQYFRDGEARVIARLLDNGPNVIATGGGAFMRDETRHRIRDKGVSIWLEVDGDVVLRRVKRRADRPLLQTADPAATIEKLITARNPIYGLADVKIASRDVAHDKIVEECLDALHAFLQTGHQTSQDEKKDEQKEETQS